MKGDAVFRMSFEHQKQKEPLIVFEAVGKTFNTKAGERVEAIRDVSFTVAENQFVTIVGSSGCGKSTLLKMLAGLLAPTRGQLTVQGQGAHAQCNVGMVFQRPALLPWRNVLGNILLPSIITGMDRHHASERAHDLLELVGLSDFAMKYPNELSGGGMQQRVAICTGDAAEAPAAGRAHKRPQPRGNAPHDGTDQHAAQPLLHPSYRTQDGFGHARV
jgi:ABC-type nitrate/sulfonate/bicarbonate transport system ATPase subunit